MTPALLSLPILSLLLLGAHFWRASAWWGVGACAAVLLLMTWRRPWVLRLVQAALLLGALEWLWSAVWLVQQRAALGQPWLRLAVILSVVATVSTLSAFALQHPRLRTLYRAR